MTMSATHVEGDVQYVNKIPRESQRRLRPEKDASHFSVSGSSSAHGLAVLAERSSAMASRSAGRRARSSRLNVSVSDSTSRRAAPRTQPSLGLVCLRNKGSAIFSSGRRWSTTRQVSSIRGDIGALVLAVVEAAAAAGWGLRGRVGPGSSFLLLHGDAPPPPPPWIRERLSWVSRYTAEKLVKPR